MQPIAAARGAVIPPEDPGTGAMPLRLGYNKSRAGCLRCKQRRVKVCSGHGALYNAWLILRQCDEKRPCAACSRHGIRCSLLDASPEPTASSRLPPAQKSKVTKVRLYRCAHCIAGNAPLTRVDRVMRTLNSQRRVARSGLALLLRQPAP